jgi:hypothetical protein
MKKYSRRIHTSVRVNRDGIHVNYEAWNVNGVCGLAGVRMVSIMSHNGDGHLENSLSPGNEWFASRRMHRHSLINRIKRRKRL